MCVCVSRRWYKYTQRIIIRRFSTRFFCVFSMCVCVYITTYYVTSKAKSSSSVANTSSEREGKKNRRLAAIQFRSITHNACTRLRDVLCTVGHVVLRVIYEKQNAISSQSSIFFSPVFLYKNFRMRKKEFFFLPQFR